METIAELIQEVVTALCQHYGDRLDRIMLYGSYARGDHHEESDVDFLVVLNEDTVANSREVRETTDAICRIMERFGYRMISVFAVTRVDYETSTRFFMRNVRRDAVFLYERRPEFVLELR